MNRKIIAAVAVVPLALAGCSGGNDWESALYEWTQDMVRAEGDLEQGCLGIALLGIDTPEQLGALMLAVDTDDLLDADMTLAEAVAADEDIDLSEAQELGVPDDVTVRDIANVAGEAVLDLCP
jgi:hypothetical protein